MSGMNDTVSTHTVKLIDQFSATSGAVGKAAVKQGDDVKRAAEAAAAALAREHDAALRLNAAFDKANYARVRAEAARMNAEFDKTAVSMGKAHSEAVRMNREFDRSQGLAGKLRGAFGGMGTELLAAAGWAGAIATIGVGVKAVFNEALEAEASAIRFNRAAINAGEAGSAAAEGIDDWAEQMLRTRGLGDELAKDLVSQGLAMNLTIEQGKRLVEVATDVAASLGIDVTTAMKQLTLASDGDSRSMAMLARQFNITVTEGMSFEEMLAKVGGATAGAAADKVDTLRGSVRLLWEEFLNFSSPPVIAAMDNMQGAVNMLGNAASEAGRQRGMRRAQLSRDYSGVATNDLFKDYADTLERVPSALAKVKEWNETFAKTGGLFAQQRDEAVAYLQELLKVRDLEKAELDRRRSAGAATSSDPAKFGINWQAKLAEAREQAQKEAEARAKIEEKAAAEKTKLAEQFAADQKERDLQTAIANREVWTEEMLKAAKAFADAQEDLFIRLRTRLGNFGTTTDMRDDPHANVARYRLEQGLGHQSVTDQRFDAETQLMRLSIAAGKATDAEIEAEKFRLASLDVIAKERDAELMNERTWWREKLEEGKKQAALSAAANKEADMAKVQAAYAYAQVMIGLAKAVASGDMTGAAGGVGTMMMMYGAGSGNAGLFAAGAGLATLSQLGGDGVSNTAGGRGQADLAKVFEQAGVKTGHGIGKEDDVFRLGDVGNSGDAFRMFAEALVGQDKAGQGAEMVAGYFEQLAEQTGRLSLTTGEQQDAMGDLLAMVNATTAAEGEFLAGRMRLLSMDQMSAEQYGATLESMKDSNDAMKRRKELEEEFAKDLDRYLKAERGSKEELLAKVELGGDRAALVEQMKKDRADQESWEKEMLEAGLSPEDLASTAEGVKGTNMWLEIISGQLGSKAHSGYYPSPGASGERWEKVLNNELILRPEQYQRDLRTAAQSSGGGGRQEIVLNVDGREMTRVVIRHGKQMKSRREAA